MAKAAKPRQRAVTAVTAPTGRPASPDRPLTGAPVEPGRPSAAVPSLHPLRVLTQVARCGFVVVAAGVLVAGDLGSASLATSAAGASSASSSAAPVLSGLSVRRVEVQRLAESARAESLALAQAALDAAAAADALSRAVPTGDVLLEVSAGAGDDPAAAEPTPQLTPEQSATLGTLRAAGDLPALPQPLERLPVRRADAGEHEPTATSTGRSTTERRSGERTDGATAADDAGLDDAGLDDAEAWSADADSADLTDATTADDATAGDAALDDASVGDPDASATGDGPAADAAVTDDTPAHGDLAADAAASAGSTAGVAGSDGAVTDDVSADEAQQLAAAVSRLVALVAATAPGSPRVQDDVLAVGSDAAPDVTAPDVAGPDVTAPDLTAAPQPPAQPVDAAGDPSSAVPVPVPVNIPVTVPLTEAALTDAVREAAGAVFALSLRVEELTQTAARAELATRDEALVDLNRTATSVVESADALVELDPLSDEERAHRAALAARQVRTDRVPARLSATAPSAVADLAARWDNGEIPSSAMCEVVFDTRQLLQCDAAESLGELNEAYREDFGTDLALTDSYRSLESQVAVKQAKGFLAATPGTSNHGWGLAIDVAGAGGVGSFDSPVYLWLKENAEDFGWHHPRGMEPGGSGPQEPWHWEFATR